MIRFLHTTTRDDSSFRWHFHKHFPPTSVALLKTIKIFDCSRWLFEFSELLVNSEINKSWNSSIFLGLENNVNLTVKHFRTFLREVWGIKLREIDRGCVLDDNLKENGVFRKFHMFLGPAEEIGLLTKQSLKMKVNKFIFKLEREH